MLAMLASSWELNHLANIVKGYAIAFGVAFAMLVVWSWWRRKLASDRLEQRVRAKQAFSRLTHQVMSQPEVALPVPAEAGVARVRYQRYVELLATTADEILLLDPAPEWRAALGRQLAPHAEVLSGAAFREGLYGILSPETRRLIDGVSQGQAGGLANVRPLRTGKA